MTTTTSRPRPVRQTLRQLGLTGAATLLTATTVAGVIWRVGMTGHLTAHHASPAATSSLAAGLNHARRASRRRPSSG